MTVNGLYPWLGGQFPMAQITPFTYREGATMLHIMREFEKWLRNIGIEMDGKLTAYLENLVKIQDGWKELFDKFMADVDAELQALNDQAVANLVNNAQSKLRIALDQWHYDKKRVRSNVVFYVSPSGSDANNGKTPQAPRATINKIIEETQDDFYGLGTEIVINLAAGTYTENVRFENTTGETKRYRIRGPEVEHPARPLVRFSHGLGASQSAFIARSKDIDLTLEFIECYGYNGNSSAGGIVIADAKLTTNNVHCTNCFWGITASRANLIVPNGVFESCGRVQDGSSSAGAGIRSLMLTNHAIGNQYGNRASSTIFRNNNYGFLAQESSVGHVDYATFENNDYGLVVRVNSRANAGTAYFEGNTTAILSTGNSYVLTNADAFGANNTYKQVSRAGGIVALTTFDAFVKGIDIAALPAIQKLVATYDSISHTGPSSYIYEQILAKNFWDMGKSTRYPARKVTVKLTGFISGTSTEKSLGVRLGVAADDANISFTIPAGSSGPFIGEVAIAFREPGVQVMSGQLNVTGANALVGSKVSTVNMSGDKQLRVSASTASADDVVNVRSIEIYGEL